MSEIEELRQALGEATLGRQRAQAATRALAEVGRALSTSLDPDVVARSAVDHLCRLLAVNVAVLFRLDPESGDFVSVAVSADGAAVHGGSLVMPKGFGAVGLAAREHRPVTSANVFNDPRIVLHEEFRHRLVQTGHGAVLAIPLGTGQGQITGALALADRTGREFTAEEVALAEALAGQAAVAFENARLHAETERRLRDTELLLTVSQAVSASLDVTDTMRGVAEAAGRVFGADMVGAYLADPTETVLLPIAGYHVPKPMLEAFREFPIPLKGNGLLEEAWRELRPVWSDDLVTETRIDRHAWSRFPHQSALFVPMVVAERPIGGLFLIWWRERRTFRASEMDLAEGVARQAAVAVANSRSYRDAERRRREAEELAEVARTLIETLEAPAVARTIVERLVVMVRADSAVLRLLHADGTLVETARAGLARPAYAGETVLPAGVGLASRAIREGRSVQTQDLANEPEWRDAPAYRAAVLAMGIHGAVSVPLRVKDRIVGALSVGFLAAQACAPSEVTLLQAFADQAALALENARLYQEAQQAREALRRLSQRLMEVQEAERHRLAFELHDEIGQSLTALKLNLQMAERATPAGAAARLDDAVHLADRVLKQVRSLSLDLRPALLDDLGLSAALDWYVREQAERAGLAAEVTTALGDTRLPASVSTACFRVVQEAVTNVLRHARARRLSLAVRAHDHRIELTIEDDGVGFDVTAMRRHIHGRTLGLMSMEERVSLVGGELAIDSAPGRGTRIRVTCPL